VVTRLRAEGVRSYLPRFLEFPAKGGAPEAFVLFPRYLFVWADQKWSEIRATRGVVDFVRMCGEPARVRQSVVDKLIASHDQWGYVRFGPQFADGDRVRIEAKGVMNGQVGVCRGMSERQRVKVLFTMLGRETEVVMREQDLVAA
jgi:transcription antitermination factor NusG